jgi:hypothetical protein
MDPIVHLDQPGSRKNLHDIFALTYPDIDARRELLSTASAFDAGIWRSPAQLNVLDSYRSGTAAPAAVGPTQAAIVAAALACARIAYCHEAVGAMDRALKLSIDCPDGDTYQVPRSPSTRRWLPASPTGTSLSNSPASALWATLVLLDDLGRYRRRRCPRNAPIRHGPLDRQRHNVLTVAQPPTWSTTTRGG